MLRFGCHFGSICREAPLHRLLSSRRLTLVPVRYRTLVVAVVGGGVRTAREQCRVKPRQGDSGSRAEGLCHSFGLAPGFLAQGPPAFCFFNNSSFLLCRGDERTSTNRPCHPPPLPTPLPHPNGTALTTTSTITSPTPTSTTTSTITTNTNANGTTTTTTTPTTNYNINNNSRRPGREENQNNKAEGDKRPLTPLARIVSTDVALEAQEGKPLAGNAELPRPMGQSAGSRTVTTTTLITTNGDGGGGGGSDIAPSSGPGRGVEKSGSASHQTSGVDRESGSVTVTSSEKWTVTETAISGAHPNRPRVVSSRSTFESLRSTLSSPGGVVEQQASVQGWAVEAAAGEAAGAEPGRRMAFSGTSTSLALVSSVVSPREQGPPPLGERSELESPREAGEEGGGGLAEAELGSLQGQSSRRRDDSSENRH